MLEEITRKVVSYCDIPEELTEGTWMEEKGQDVYVDYNLTEDKHTYDDLDK